MIFFNNIVFPLGLFGFSNKQVKETHYKKERILSHFDIRFLHETLRPLKQADFATTLNIPTSNYLALVQVLIFFASHRKEMTEMVSFSQFENEITI
jgi:hypothetical protein